MHFHEVEALVEDVIQAARSMLERQGYSFAIKRKHQSIYRSVAFFSSERFEGKYSFAVGEAYVQQLLYRDPPLSKEYLSTNIVAIERLNHVLENDFDWYPSLRPELEYAQSRFSKVLLEYNEFLQNSGKTKSDVRSRMHLTARFLQYADQQGVRNLQDLKVQHIYESFEAASDKGGFRRAIMAFLRYAHRHELIKEKLSLIVPTVSRHTAVPTVYSPEEVERILTAASKSKKTGRRNYAITLLAARLGLRSCDITNLTFENLRLDTDMIEITQIKTKEQLVLPLLPEIREAIADYVEKERPISDSDKIFVRISHPIGSPLLPHSVYVIVSRIIADTEIDTKGRTCGAHALRSSLATALLNEGNEYPVIQKVLGHTSPNAAKSYVKVDIEHLRAYALPVPAPAGGFARRLGLGVDA